MKTSLILTALAVGLFVSGSILAPGSSAQVRSRKSPPGASQKPAKAVNPLKRSSLKTIRTRSAKGETAVGDPCLTNTPITLGTPVSAALDVGDCQLDDGTFVDFYIFHGTSGQPIYLTLSSDTLDTYLYLLSDQGDVIDENDDSDGTNSRIPEIRGVMTLPYTGDFIIAANSFDPGSGAYTLSLNSDAACSATAITYNQPVNGNLADTDCTVGIGGDPYFTDLYTFNGTAGQQVSITMTSTQFDAYLIFHTPSGTGSVEDDDSGGGTDARIPESGTITLPETGTYTIETSSANLGETGSYTLNLLGPTVVPPTSGGPFDFDGDGKTEIGIFRPEVSEWWYSRSSDNVTAAAQFGAPGDIIVPADYTGDGKTDISIFRPSTGEWFIGRSDDGSYLAFPFGTSGDIPVPADYDNDGKADAAVYRPSANTWYILPSGGGGITITQFGVAGDKPVVADYDGDGKADIAVFRPGTGEWWISRSSAGILSFQFGTGTDIPVQGDFTGDGKADVAVWRPSTGEWYVLRSEDGSFFSTPFGITGDVPAPGDFDGDGKFDLAVFRPSAATWYINRSTAGLQIAAFGLGTDRPIPNAYVP
ncbi:MAG TPA: FG-GAP-like repeat-containing protein [Pyrinomonadaceae bacterium]|nr:FG-GAP-like repeat-containing protein [Pyrinomonadaceae bacterium]